MNYIQIVKDEDTLVAECDQLVTVQAGGFRRCEIVIYPIREVPGYVEVADHGD